LARRFDSQKGRALGHGRGAGPAARIGFEGLNMKPALLALLLLSLSPIAVAQTYTAIVLTVILTMVAIIAISRLLGY
jgi:hypothetical protein